MFIAEIGINHNGDLTLAKRMIMMARDAGADVVKFQKRNPDVCVPESQKVSMKKTPWGMMTYLDYKYKMEFGKEEYDEIDRFCKKVGIQWTASVWDIDSLNFLLQYNPPFIKVASACLTDIPLLTAIKQAGLPVVISCGMSKLEDLMTAWYILKDLDLTILHCNSSYPSRDEELDLTTILYLRDLFPNCKIGYSGHEEGIMPSIIAAAYGAQVIERHITLDKEMWGSDQKASLTEDELKELIYNIKKLPIWLGTPQIKCYPSEELIRSKLRRK